MTVRHPVRCLLTFCMIVSAAACSIADTPEVGTLTFEGMWFEVDYPADFEADGSLKSDDDPEKYDSATFTSPDGMVSFYVCSAQWYCTAEDIILDQIKETAVAEETSEGQNRTVKHFTIEAKDSSYTRSYQDVREQDGSIRWVIGVTYRDLASYRRYLDEYQAFKSSLRQFAD